MSNTGRFILQKLNSMGNILEEFIITNIIDYKGLNYKSSKTFDLDCFSEEYWTLLE